MSAVTDDLDSSPADLAANRLYDPAFKLFGTTIPVSCECPITSTDVQEPGSLTMAATSGGASSVQDIDDENPESENESFTRDELGSSSGSNDGGDEEKLVELISDQQEVAAVTPINLIENGLNDVCVPNTYEHPQGEEAMEHETPKKPEKPIPCPRCQSLDTKFCYFNNYNVNQPRHFCKNCQRYWTAGGTLRNVPVGAGRRKNKHSSSPHARGTFPDHAVVRGDPPENAQQITSCPSSAQTGMRRQINPAMPPVSTPTHMLPVNLQSVPSFESTQSSAILSFGQESPVRVSTRDPSCTPCQSEVLQGYKQETSPQQATNTFSLPKTGGAQSQLISHAERSHNEVVTGASVDGRYPKLQKFHVKQPATERPLEPEGSVTGTPKSEPSGVGDFPKYIDAALAWATGGPFSFMGLPWQYSAGLGWGAASPPVGHGSAGQIPNTSAGLANVLPGTSTTHNMGVAGSQHGAGFGGQAPWATALGPWAGANPWSIIQNPVWVPPGWGGPWAMPWAAPLTAAAAAAAAATAAAAAAAAAVNSDVGAMTLGKHPREPEDDAGGVKGRPLLVPKTLRIDDPGDAARSSIWSTLGIDPCGDNFTRGGMFKGRQSKADGEINHPNTCTRNSNPAALNRIMTFQESNLTVPTFDIKDT